MPYKNIEDSRAAIRRHYYKNKSLYLKKNNLRREKLRRYVRKLKENGICKDCSIQFPYYVMDFDHLGDKNNIISKMVNSGNKSALMRELEKCELVCANCHRIRSYKRQQNRPA